MPPGGEDDAVTLRTVGEVPAYDFPLRDHIEIGEALGAIDMERGAKVSGARFYFLTAPARCWSSPWPSSRSAGP